VKSQIRIDWEHTRFLWLDPTQAVRDIETRRITAVPRLEDSLRRVWFEADLGEPAGAILRRGLAELANDHESGANALARRALMILREVVAALENAEVENDSVKGEWSWWWDRIRMAGWHLWKNGRDSMGAAILSALLGAMGRMEKAAQETGSVVSGSDAEKKQTWKNLALRELDAFLQARSESSQRITTSFSAYLTRHFPTKLSSHDPLRVLTLSDSATIYSGLRHAALNTGFLLDLRVLESRPLYEGVSLAAALANDLGSSRETHGASQQHKVTLYTDASTALAAAGVDIVVIGADRIAASGAVSNKTGSLPAVLAAKHVAPASKVVVLGGTEKIAPPGRPEDHVVEDNDPNQVSRAWLEQYNSARVLKGAETLQHYSVLRDESAVSTKIHNIFFEWVPQHLIDAYITESGEWTQEHISEHSTKLAAEEEHIFAHL
jgi:translation initiation factor 2B subunit (eIF-2B alpha/beta/delta family)